ncbi:hypothetical protein D3C80_1497900 [compost metagenome]
MLAIGTRQVDPFGEAGQAKQDAGIATVDACLVLVQGFLLGQVALDKHLLAPVTVQAVEHVLHLFARRKQHQRTARAFDQVRQVTNDRRGMGRGVAGVGAQVRHP